MGNKQGKLVIKQYLEKSGAVTDDELKSLYNQYDNSHDGMLQRTEAAEHLTERIEKGKPSHFTKETLKDAKKKWQSSEYQNNIVFGMDKNDDDEISFDEFKVWFKNFLDYGNVDHETRKVEKVNKGKDEDDNKMVNGYTYLNPLGKGSYGKVSLVLHQDTNKGYALKTMNKTKLKSVKMDQNHTALDALYEEINVMKLLKHPNVIKLYEVMDDPNQDKIYLLVEFCEKGIAQDIRKGQALSEDLSKKYFIDMMLGVEYMHKSNVIHRDIKPENLLVDGNGVLKIADFGTAKIVLLGYDIIKIGAGTPAFASPESIHISNDGYSGRIADIWAAGVSLYCFLTGTLPFEGDTIQEMFTVICEKEPSWKFSGVSKDAIDLMQKMLTKNPEKRLYKIDDIKKHPWVKDCSDWNKYDEDKSINWIHNDKIQKALPSPSLNKTSSFSLMSTFKSVSEAEEGPPQRRPQHMQSMRK